MNTTWLKTAFVLSLVLNCMAAGGVTYKYFFAPQGDQTVLRDKRPARVHLLGRDARRQPRDRLSGEREHISSAQEELLTLLMQEPPDRDQIKE